MIRFRCSCGRMLQARPEHVGQEARCPACEAVLLVPSEQDVLRAPAPAPAPVVAEREAPPPAWKPPADEADEGAGPGAEPPAEAAEAPGPRQPLLTQPTADEDRPSRKAAWSVVLGCLSPFLLLAGPVVGLAAVVLGVLARRDIARSEGRLGGHTAALAGLLMGALGMLVSLGASYLAAPELFKGTEAGLSRRDADNLRAIGRALLDYHDEQRGFPPAAAFRTADGEPGLSWRVAILPKLGQGYDDLYRRFRRDEPWDSDHNIQLLRLMPREYQSPGRENTTGQTSYQVLVGPGTAFEPRPLAEGRLPTGWSLADLANRSNTILVATADRTVPWTKPEDLAPVAPGAAPTLSRRLRTGSNALMADGEVRWLPHDTPAWRLSRMARRDGE